VGSFQGPDESRSVQPYVLAKANLGFASSNAALLQGQPVVLRPGTLGSGSAPASASIRSAAAASISASRAAPIRSASPTWTCSPA
jgi:hypothetical protein